MNTYKIAFLVSLILLSTSIIAQKQTSVHTKIVYNISDTIFLDSLVLPNTISIKDANNNTLNKSSYTYFAKNHGVKINSKNEITPLSIEYRIFPLDLYAEYSHKKWINNPKKGNTEVDFFSYYKKQNNNSRSYLGLNNFQKDGSISRTVSVGNSQNLSVMSHMNLQIAGNISQDLELIASISDDNIPIQPDGNTQQLQDFDKVFIQLKHKNGQITAGDFEMRNPKSNYLRYHKKAQGANASVNLKLNNNKTLNVYGGIALSKGKYARNNITSIEGNQGPYKLSGANFERAIIVLSGTERIFIDGKEMQRGQNYDYVIDYNTAEITFTPKVLITKDKRISVEFQYSVRNYARYLANAGFDFSTNKIKIGTHYYTETDLKNQALDQELSDAQLQLLYGIGDSLHKAISPSADSIAFNGNEVLYKKIDSLGYGSIYVHSISKDSAFYRLSFSFVGVGKGNYIQIKSMANGRVYKWVTPVNGIPQGDHEPVVMLITPKKKQMLTTKLEYEIIKNTIIKAELAISNNDLNLLSPYNDENNTNYAYKVGFENKINIGQKANWQILSEANYEYIDKDFTPIERYRDIEFRRNWNSQEIINGNQQKIDATISLKDNKSSLFKYDYQQYWTGDNYDGKKNSLMANTDINNWKFRSKVTYTSTKELNINTSFLRHNISLQKELSFITIGVTEDAENNKFTYINNDSLYLNSYKYQQYEAFIQTPDKFNHNIRLHYKHRDDYSPHAFEFNKSMQANEFGFDYKLLRNKNNRLNVSADYRKLSIIDTIKTTIKPENTILGRVEHFLNIYKGSVQASSFYEIGSGMESRKDYAYIEVAAGQGVYSWNDYNNNGVKELNEFEIAIFKDQANYIRIYVPSNDYIKTYNNTFSTSITLSPSRIWRQSSSKILKTISKFANQLVYRSSIKTLNSNWQEYANPFYHNINDTSLMSINTSFRNTFYFNRGHSKYGIDYTYLHNNNKVLMMNGYQGRSRHEHQIKLRWNINRIFLLQLEGNMGEKLSISDFYKDKEFDIKNRKTKTKLSYQPNRILRISLPISIEFKNNSIDYGGENSQSYKFGLSTKYSLLNNGSWTASVEYINIKYSGLTTGAIAFEMLQGFMPGNNLSWIINYQRNILNNLQLNIMYNGRKSEGTDIIHVGSLQLRAFF